MYLEFINTYFYNGEYTNKYEFLFNLFHIINEIKHKDEMAKIDALFRILSLFNVQISHIYE